MRLLVLSWLLAATMIGACTSMYVERELTPFEEVCALVEEEFGDSCWGIDPPILIVSSIADVLGAYGVYVHDEQYIFISPSLTNEEGQLDPTRREVIVHETVHYVLWELDIEQGECPSERLAREWTEKITGVPLDPLWVISYGCDR